MTKVKSFPKGIFPKVVETKIGTVTKLGIKKKEFIEYLQTLDEKEEFLNLDIVKMMKPTGKQTHYIVVDDWKPTPKNETLETPTEKNVDEDELFNFN